MKNIFKYIFMIFVFLLISTPLDVFASDTFYMNTDISDISDVIKNSSYSDDLVSKVTEYCNKRNIYFFITSDIYFRYHPCDRKIIRIICGGDDKTLYISEFTFLDNVFDSFSYFHSDFNTNFSDCILGNFNLPISNLAGKFTFSSDQLKEKYKINDVTNVTYNTYTTDNNDSSNILYSLKTNNSLLVIISSFILFFFVIFVFYKIFHYFF